MNLATRCTACGTVFRVVQDHLKVSEGWVRCGRCDEVFDARAQLFDLDNEAPPPWPATPEPEAQVPDDDLFEPEAVRADETASSEPLSDSSSWEDSRSPDNGFAISSQAQTDSQAPLPSEFPATVQWTHPPQSEFGSEVQAHFSAIPDGETTQARPQEPPLADVNQLAADPGDSPHSTPSFMRKSVKERAPQTNLQRRIWTGTGVLLGLLLVGQAFFYHRDSLAALDPRIDTQLRAWCQMLSCEIRPLRRIEALSVQSSALTPMAGKAHHYRLTVQVRNRADISLALPSIDLSLTDSSGGVLVRRVLSPSEFAASSPAAASSSPSGSIAAGSELSLQTVLNTAEARLVGYTVEVFYP